MLERVHYQQRVWRARTRHRVSVWLYEGRLQIAYQDALVARYTAPYDRRRKRLRAVSKPVLYQTSYATPQLELWDLDDEQWHKVLEHPMRQRRTQQASGPWALQLPLELALAVLLLTHYGDLLNRC